MIADEKIDWQEVNTLIAEKRADELYPVLRERVDKNPDDHDAGCALARILLDREEYETAHEWLWRIVKKDPHHWRAAKLLNRVRLATGSDFGKPRPRLLVNLEKDRVTRALMPWADLMLFVPQKTQQLPEFLNYDIYRDTFADIIGKLPVGWEPDWVLFFINEMFPLPLGLQNSPFPTLCLPGDCFPLHKLSGDAQFFDAVFPGLKPYETIFSRIAPGRTLYRAGAAIQGAIADLHNEQRYTKNSGERPYDVVFIGDFGNPYYARRTRYIERLLRLKNKYNILVSEKKFTFREYLDYLCQAKIVIETPNVQGGVNMRSFEACQSGAMLMHEELDRSIAEFFEPGKEVVLFDEENFEHLLDHYLQNDDERIRIAEQGRNKALQSCTLEVLGRETLAELSLAEISRLPARPAEEMTQVQRFNEIACSDFYAGLYDRALDLLQIALQQKPDSVQLINNLAVVCHALAAHLEDESLRQKAIEMLKYAAAQKSFLLSRFNLLQITSRENAAAALHLAERLIDELQSYAPADSPGDDSPFDGLVVHHELVPERHLSHFPPEAIAIEQLLEKFPKNSPDYNRGFAHILLWKTRQIQAQLFLQTQQFAQAEAEVRAAISLAPQNHNLWFELGGILLEQKKWDEAENAFRESLRILPLCFETDKGLVTSLVGAGKVEQAQKHIVSVRAWETYKEEQYEELEALLKDRSAQPSVENVQKSLQAIFKEKMAEFLRSNPDQKFSHHPDWPLFVEEYEKFFAAFPESQEGQEFRQITLLPQLDDRTATTQFDRFYFYQDTWAARKIFEIKPSSLVDVASKITFVGLISGFVPTTFVDIRPIDVNLDGLTVKKGDILDMPFESGSVEMVSSLSVVEHIGLGRYGDDIMPDGSRRACAELLRIVRPGGYLLIAVPAGPPMIAFNAHRIFSCEQILSYFPGTKVLDEAFLYPTPGPREGMRYLKPGKYVFYCFLLQKEGGAVDEKGKEKSSDHGDHRARWLVSD